MEKTQALMELRIDFIFNTVYILIFLTWLGITLFCKRNDKKDD